MERTYVMTNHDLVLDGATLGIGKRYELRVRDMPSEDKPRERLLSNGPAGLSVKELLAIVLVRALSMNTETVMR
jgi:hypothetical protein